MPSARRSWTSSTSVTSSMRTSRKYADLSHRMRMIRTPPITPETDLMKLLTKSRQIRLEKERRERESSVHNPQAVSL
jgi:hypothetical protein